MNGYGSGAGAGAGSVDPELSEKSDPHPEIIFTDPTHWLWIQTGFFLIWIMILKSFGSGFGSGCVQDSNKFGSGSHLNLKCCGSKTKVLDPVLDLDPAGSKFRIRIRIGIRIRIRNRIRIQIRTRINNWPRHLFFTKHFDTASHLEKDLLKELN